MEKIIAIIMERDELSYEEAKEIVSEAREEMLQAAADEDMEAAEEIMYDNLGLEMDYLLDLIL